MTAPFLLRGVDLAAFAVALVNRLHTGGVVVSASGPAGFVEALQHDWPRTRLQLYWAARLTLVNRVEDLAEFDAIFEAVFADAVLGVDPPGLKQSMGTTAAADPGVPGRASVIAEGGLPWSTRPASITAVDTHAADIGIRAGSSCGRMNRLSGSIPTTSACSANGWRAHWTAGPGAAACAASRTGAASVLTCGRP